MIFLRMKPIAWTMGAATLAMLAGCLDTISSEHIKTSGIFAELKILATSDTSTTVEATLKLGGPGSDTFVDLAVDDSLIASAATDSKVMRADYLSGPGFYTAKFPNAAENTDFTIDLLRNREGDEQAPNSAGTLPAPFKLGAFSDFSRSREDFTISWDPSGSGDTMRLHAVNDTNCPLSFDANLPGDAGSYTFPKGSLKYANGFNPQACTFRIELTRTRKGAVDSHYARGSSLELSQVRTATVRSIP